MRYSLALLILTLTPAWCQAAKPAAFTNSRTVAPPKAARIPSQTMSVLERNFDNRLETIGTVDDRVDRLRDTLGVQLDDYGVVFTAEVSLVITPGLMPGRPKIPPEMAERVHKLRVERLPLLKGVMMSMMGMMAAAFTQLPENQKLVLVVRLYYGPWEDTTGMPSQVTMRADRAGATAFKVETEDR